MNSIRYSYLFWGACILGLNGCHRLYNGKILTGLLWLFTGGLFGIGQFIDLLLIPNMVEEHNTKVKAKLGTSSQGVPLYQSNGAVSMKVSPPQTRQQLMVALLRSASTKGGKLSVSQGVMETGASFLEVEEALKEMLKTGYVSVDNHPETGIVIYDFHEL
ncbi:MAG: NINE protein [Okeania sp. SIO3B3]|nr:NINE protein [Okeania sp. SIO3B3]